MTKTCENCQATFEPKHNGHHARRCPACRRVHAAEYRAKYKLLAGKFCDCGQEATTYFNGERCCERCKQIDQGRVEAEKARLQKRKEQAHELLEERSAWRAISRSLEGRFNPVKQAA